MLSKTQLIELLRNDKRAVARALVVLAARQTLDEQRSLTTKYLNGQGFRPCHAKKGTDMAHQFQRTGYLSDNQIAYWRYVEKTGKMRIEIYWRQLLEAAAEKAQQKA